MKIIGLILGLALVGGVDGMSWQRESQARCGKLMNAVLEGKADDVRRVLKEGADANCKDDSGAPAIIFPAANGDLSILSALLSAGADVNARDATGVTPLMSAAFMGHEEVIKALAERGAKTEERDGNGYTALMFAANAGKVGAAKALLRAGARVNARDKDGSTPIMFAAQHGHDFVVMLLLSHGADPRAKGNHGLSAIGFAEQNKHAETLRILHNPSVVAVVRVDKGGRVYLNRKAVTAGELKREFARLKGLGGTVWYYRENPESDAPPQALEVITLVAEARLPIVLLEVDLE